MADADRFPPVPVRSQFFVTNSRIPGNEMNTGIPSLHVRLSGTVVNKASVTRGDQGDHRTYSVLGGCLLTRWVSGTTGCGDIRV